MTDREELKSYGCFRCGAEEGGFEYDEAGFAVCLCCGERAIVNFRQALDLLNDFHRRGFTVIEDPEQQEGLEEEDE